MTRQEENEKMIEFNTMVNEPCEFKQGLLTILETINAAV